MLQQTNITNMSNLIQHITDENTIFICSDGALKGEYPGGAWVTAGANGDILANGVNPNTVRINFQTSYRL